MRRRRCTLIGALPREPTFRSLGYATLTRDYAILPMLGRAYWPMLAMLSLPYTGYAHAILCWCFILAYSDSNTGTFRCAGTPRAVRGNASMQVWSYKSSELEASYFFCAGPDFSQHRESASGVVYHHPYQFP